MSFDIKPCQGEGFNLEFSVFASLYFSSCRKKPKVSKDFSDDIHFIVTHAVNAGRFWIHLIDQASIYIIFIFCLFLIQS